MTDWSSLSELELRLRAASAAHWYLARGRDGEPVVMTRWANGDERPMRVTRDEAPASLADVRFIAMARGDVERLLAHLRGEAQLTRTELDEIEGRASGASPAPWIAFLESEGGLGGCSAIGVSDRDDEPDIYLWAGDGVAPDADFAFVAAAREGIPRLVAEARRRLALN